MIGTSTIIRTSLGTDSGKQANMNMPDKLRHTVAELEQYFASKPQVALAYLFGSQASGKVHPGSDLDLGILLAENIPQREYTGQRLEIIGDLMQLLKSNDVDVVILNQVPLVMRYQVISNGKLLFCRDRQEAIDFRVQTLNSYFDFQPILDHHREIFFQKIREGKFLHGHNRYRGALTSNKKLPSDSV